MTPTRTSSHGDGARGFFPENPRKQTLEQTDRPPEADEGATVNKRSREAPKEPRLARSSGARGFECPVVEGDAPAHRAASRLRAS